MTAHLTTKARGGAVMTVRGRAGGVTVPALSRGQRPFAGRWVLGYFPGWKADTLPTTAIDWALLTDVAVFSAVPRVDGTLDESFFHTSEAEGRTWAKTVCDTARAHGVGTVLTIGGGGFHDAFKTAMGPTVRGTLASSILALGDYLSVTQVDLDFEPLAYTDIPDVVALAGLIRAARPAWRLSIPCGQINANNPGIVVGPDTAQLGAVFDQVNLMTYGMSSDWAGWTSWHSSPLYGEAPTHPVSIDHDVQVHIDHGVPAGKIGVGIGGYGLGLTGVTGPDQTGAATVGNSDSLFPQGTIADTYAPAMQPRWDDRARVPYLTSTTPTGPSQVTYISHEDARSIGEKVAYVKRQRLGGVILWQLPQARRPGQPDPWAYLRRIPAALNSGQLEAVTPAPPVFTDAGAGAGTVTIPSTDGATYLLDGAPVEAGARPATGTSTVTARVTLGRVITPGAETSWTHTYSTATVTTNYAPNPRQIQGGTSMIESSSGTSYLTSSTGWPSDPATSTARRRAATAAGTLTIAWLIDVSTVPDGTEMVASLDARLSAAKTGKSSWQWLTPENTNVGTAWYSSNTTTFTAGEARIFTYPSQTKPAGAARARLSVSMNSAVAGDHIESTNIQLSTGSVSPPFFDGDTPDTSTSTYTWTGTRGASPSTHTQEH